MSGKLVHFVAESRPPEPTIQQEVAGLGDDDLMDFMNLTARQTGIDGVVFISTAMGSHGPRVKFFEKTGKGQPSFSVSIDAQPRVLASSLPQAVVNRMAPDVQEWVRRNHETLLAFWDDGQYWSDDEVTAFKARLDKIR